MTNGESGAFAWTPFITFCPEILTCDPTNVGRSLYYCVTQRLLYLIKKISPANVETSLEKATTDDEAPVHLIKFEIPDSTTTTKKRVDPRCEKGRKRDRLREERKQGHQSNDQRKIACTRTSATHGSSDIPRLSPSGLGGVVRSASCRRVVMVAAIRRSQPASLAPIYLLTSNPTETTESPSYSLTLRNDFFICYSQGIRISAIKQSPKLFLNQQLFLKN